MAVTASVWVIKFGLYPKKKKKVKISDYTLKKEKKRKHKALKKKLKKNKELQNAKKSSDVKPKEKKSLLESLGLIHELLTAFVGGVVKHVKIKTTKIQLTVASDDAAKTALLYAAASNAVLMIIPMQDWLCLDSSARMNTPGTANGNWQWRLLPGELTSELAERIAALTRLAGRI